MQIFTTEHFTLIKSVADKWGRRRLALVEHPQALHFVQVIDHWGNVDWSRQGTPTRIDPRSKKIKCFIKIWDVTYATRRGVRMFWRIEEEADLLVQKLERLWPMHFMAKELRQRSMYMRQVLNKREQAFVIAVIPRLIQPAQTYLKELGNKWDNDAEYRKEVKRKTAAIKHKMAETKRLRRGDDSRRRRNPETD